MPIPSLCPLQSSQSVIPPIRMSSEMWGCFVVTGMRDHKDILMGRADKPCNAWTDPQEEELCQLQKPHWTLSRLKHTHETFIPFYKKPTLKSILYTEFSRKPTTWWKWRENGSLELKKNTSPLWKLHLYSHVGHTDGHTDAIHLYQFPFVAVAFLITGESIWLLNSLCNCA